MIIPEEEKLKLKDGYNAPTYREVHMETDMTPELMPPPYAAPAPAQSSSSTIAGPSSTPAYTPPTPAQYDSPVGPPPPPTLAPANYVYKGKFNSSIDAEVLLDLALPFVARAAGMQGNWFTQMLLGSVERREEKRAFKDKYLMHKELQREQLLGMVGLRGGAAAREQEMPPTRRTGVGLREVQPNLFLEGHNLGVSGEVWVLDSGARRERGRAVLKLVNHNAKVDLMVHTVSLDAGRRRPHLSITTHTHHSSVNIALPRDFRGQLQLSSDHGRIRLSPALNEVTTRLSKTYRTWMCFVGQMPESWHTLTVRVGTDCDASEGVDEAVAVTHNGSVTVRFEDEPPLEGLISEVVGSLKRVVVGKNGKSTAESRAAATSETSEDLSSERSGVA